MAIFYNEEFYVGHTFTTLSTIHVLSVAFGIILGEKIV
jgi:hypothetical protein